MKTSRNRICRQFWLLPIFIAVLFASHAAEPPEPAANALKTTQPLFGDTPFLFADFEKGRAITIAGVPWEVFTDASMGGKSTLETSMISNGAQGSKGALRLTAKLAPDFQWGGFAGVRAWLQSDKAPKDMSAASGVQFYARGDGKTYHLLVARENVKNGNHFAAEFTAPAEWTRIQVPFAKLAQSPYFGAGVPWSPTNVTGVGFLARAEGGATVEARLEVDEIRFYSGR